MADEFNPANVEQYRADFQATFRPDPRATPENNAAALASHMSRFDIAIAADGGTLPSDAGRAAIQKAAGFGIAHAPDPAAYKFELPQQIISTLDTKRLVAIDAEMKAWAAASAMDPVLADGLLTRVAEVGQETSGLSEEAKVRWHDQNKRLMVGVLGSEAAYDKAIEEAKYALGIVQGDAGKFGKAIAGSLALYDPICLQALAYHGRQHRLHAEAT